MSMLAATYNIKAQSCVNATTVPIGISFEYYEDQGDAFIRFEATHTNMNLFLSWDSAAVTPVYYSLYSGTCKNLIAVMSDSLYAGFEAFWNFKFTNLAPNTFYFFALSGPSGFGGAGQLAVAPGNSYVCAPTNNCDYILNGGFEQFDPSIAGNLPVGKTTTAPGAPIQYADVDEVCGWANASNHPNGTPDYFLAPMSNFYTTVSCTTKSAANNGNHCVTEGDAIDGGNGVIQIFTLDARPINLKPNRREYVYTDFAFGYTQPPGIYALSLMVRHSQHRQWQCASLQALFTTGFSPVNHSEILTTAGNPQIDFTSDIAINNKGWQSVTGLYQHTGTATTQLVLGNFRSNSVSMQKVWPNNPVPQNTANSIPSMYIDNVSMVRLPDAGEDFTICEPGSVQIGYIPSCYVSGVSYTWTDLSTNTLLPNPTIPYAVNITTGGSHTYRLTLTYGGKTITDDITVSVQEPINIQPIEPTNCHGDAVFEWVNLSPNDSYSFQVLNNSVTWSGNPIVSGNTIIFLQPEILNYQGFGEVEVTRISVFNGVPCTTVARITLFDCCQQNPNADLIVAHDTYFSNLLANMPLQINGLFFNIYGTVFIDDNFTFTNCTFNLMPDAQIIIEPNSRVTFEGSTLQSCGDFKWYRMLHVQPTSSLIFSGVTLQDALIGIEASSGAEVYIDESQFKRNIIANYFNGYSNALSMLGIYNSNFELNAPDFVTVAHPSSTFNTSVMALLPSVNFIMGQRLDAVVNFSLGGGNSYITGTALSTVESRQLWIMNGSQGLVQNNTFYEGQNVYIENSNVEVQHCVFDKLSTTPNVAPSGIYANGSRLIVGNGTGSPYANSFLSGAKIGILDPTETQILNNKFEGTDHTWAAIAVEGTKVLSNLRNKIQYNHISDYRAGISVKNMATYYQYPTKHFVINFNYIINNVTVTPSANQEYVAIIASNCEGISIGQNTMICNYANASLVPTALINNVSMGVSLTDCKNAFVGCNEMHYYGRGLFLSGDVTKDPSWNNYPMFPPNFQSNKFYTNYHGLYFESNSLIPDIGASNIGADNIWAASPLAGTSFTMGARVKDMRYWWATPTPRTVKYYLSGPLGTDRDPLLSNAIFNSNQNSVLNNCFASPFSNKMEVYKDNQITLTIFPNPAAQILNYEVLGLGTGVIKYQIVDVNGRILLTASDAPEIGMLDVSSLTSGIYIIVFENITSKVTQRFAIL